MYYTNYNHYPFKYRIIVRAASVIDAAVILVTLGLFGTDLELLAHSKAMLAASKALKENEKKS